ncbi:MAG: leucine-rich repeat domain-containing protein [Promethearchaeota archaeon]
MELTTGQIIQKIVQQTNLSRIEVEEQIEQLRRSLKYDKDVAEEDATIPKLLAQEMNVDLGDPADYLYIELLFDEFPQFARIIPFATIDKEKIKEILQKYVEKPKTWVPGKDEVEPVILTVEPTLFRDGILVHYEEYTSMTPIEYSLREIIDQAELYRTFTDYWIERTEDPEKTYLPYSIVEKLTFHPPEWITMDLDNPKNRFKFPYISLECLREDPKLEIFGFVNSRVKEVKGIEILQSCPNLKEIQIYDDDAVFESFDIPTDLRLPRLERIKTYLNGKKVKQWDLSFLEHCLNLREVVIKSTIGRYFPPEGVLILPAFENHPYLENLTIKQNAIESTCLNTINCPNLKILNFSGNRLPKLDLSPLMHCPNLEELKLNNNSLKSFDLSPLQNCPNLQILDLSYNSLYSLDLSPLQHCLDLRVLSLANQHDQLSDLDLSPLRNCSTLEQINLARNHGLKLVGMNDHLSSLVKR